MPSALVTTVQIKPGRTAEAEEGLVQQIVPMIKGLPGYLSSVHISSPDGSRGMGIILFDSEETARAAAQIWAANPPPPEAPITVESREVWQVAYSG
jgi:antibiotic biosynthesis monooxygenase (ABM) superfamily enzyme